MIGLPFNDRRCLGQITEVVAELVGTGDVVMTRLAEEHETLTLTWYSPDDFAALLAQAGFRDATTSNVLVDEQGETTFSVSARA